MHHSFDVVVLVGSLRKNSYTRRVAKALMALAPANLKCRFVEFADLPLYTEDLDGHPPPAWVRFRNEVRGADAVLIATPEYNRSIPGGLKNAMDVGSRPQGESIWDGLPAAVISVSPHKSGAFGANHHLRQTLVYLNMPVMQQPEAYIPGADGMFDDQGEVKSGDSREFLAKVIGAFAAWVATLRGAASKPDGKTADFAEFLENRRKIAAAYVSGDAKPLDGIAARAGDASFFPPSGGTVTGAEAVTQRYDRDVRSFKPGGQTQLEEVQSGADGDLGYWIGIQSADARLEGRDGPVSMKLRVTELYRREDDGWKLVHRHADPAADPAVH